MATYLEQHPPRRSQFRRTRRAAVTGGICVHTAENTTDLKLPDGGAEAVARFISTRSNAGSYHSIADSDSVVRVMPYEWEAFGEGTGSNRWALHLSWACKAHQWAHLPNAWVDGAIRNGATEAARMAHWVKKTRGIIVPARRITLAEYRAGEPGFISHGEVDPGRRSDPGSEFPWDSFLHHFAEATQQETPMDEVKYLQTWLNSLDLEGEKLVVDGQRGPKTEARMAEVHHALVEPAADIHSHTFGALWSEVGARLDQVVAR